MLGNSEGVFWRGPRVSDLEGKWFEIVVHVNFNVDPSVGFVELWFNGVKQASLTGKTVIHGKTMCFDSLEDTVELKMGIYRNERYNKQGAFDYHAKPFDVDAVLRGARRALEQRRLVQENKNLRKQVTKSTLVGRSPAILEVYKQVARTATTNVPVVALFGPTLPERSMPWRRSQAKAIAVDAGALPCRPCHQRHCVPGDFRCLTSIEPERVVIAAEQLLRIASPS